jgi:hypothetical protein
MRCVDILVTGGSTVNNAVFTIQYDSHNTPQRSLYSHRSFHASIFDIVVAAQRTLTCTRTLYRYSTCTAHRSLCHNYIHRSFLWNIAIRYSTYIYQPVYPFTIVSYTPLIAHSHTSRSLVYD